MAGGRTSGYMVEKQYGYNYDRRTIGLYGRRTIGLYGRRTIEGGKFEVENEVTPVFTEQSG